MLSDQSPIRYGVISAGRMAGTTMLSIMAGHPAARPVAWYELEPQRPDTARRIEQLAAAGLARCHSLDELLARDDVDVILNSTPHYAHAETSIAALRAGHHVVCEKPPACCPDECQAMAAAAGQANRLLMIHFQHLLKPSARWLGRVLRSGRLGAIRRVRGVSLWWRNDDYYARAVWAGKRSFQGRPTLDGTLVNQTIHYLNQMLALAHRGDEQAVSGPANVRAALYRFHQTPELEMEDTAVLAGKLDNPDATEFVFAGTTCAAESGGPNRLAEYTGSTESHAIEMECEHGRAVWDGKARVEIPGREPEVFDEPEGPWPFLFHVREVLAGREQPVTPIDQACNTMRVIDAAYAAAGEIQPRDWGHHEQVADVLRRCAGRFALPAELPDPPTWA
jgi:predicted dehydrogenase